MEVILTEDSCPRCRKKYLEPEAQTLRLKPNDLGLLRVICRWCYEQYWLQITTQLKPYHEEERKEGE